MMTTTSIISGCHWAWSIRFVCRLCTPPRPGLLALGILLVLVSMVTLAQEPAANAGSTGNTQEFSSTYKLAVGDQLKISVFNQPDLSGEFQLDGDGRFSMPLIGSVVAAGLTPAELESLLVGRYKPDYLVNPRIFIQVTNARVYYLIGESLGTGAFPYVPGMSYLTAIAKSGGFTYRAKQDVVFVIRVDDPEQKEVKLSVDEMVQPGDIIRIAERLF